MKNIYLSLSIIFLPLLAAAQIYVNNFTGSSACPANGNIAAMAANASGAPLSRSTLTCSAAANVFNSTTLNNTAAIGNTSYIEFSVTANPGFQLNLISLSFFRQGSATAPNQLEVRYSTDNFNSATSWGAAPLTATTGSSLTWDFADFSTTPGATIIIRFYPFGTQRCDLATGAASASGTFRLDDVILNGSVSPAGGPSLAATALPTFNDVCLGTTAGPDSFRITGVNLTNGNVTISALNGFSYSTTSTGIYAQSLNLSQPGGSFLQDVFVKFLPNVVQSYNGNIVIAGGGAPDATITASGGGVDTKPTVIAGSAFNTTGTGTTISDTIKATGCTALTGYGIEYSITNGFADGSGTAIAGNNLGSGIYTVVMTGLAAATTYYYKAWASNTGGISYSTQKSFITVVPEPSNHATGFSCGNSTTHSITLTWNDATGAILPGAYLIKWSATSYAAIVNPIDGTPEPDAPGAASGAINVSEGLQVAIAQGMSAGTIYYFKIFPYTNNGAAIDYKTDGSVPQTSCTTTPGALAAWDFTGNNTASATFAATSFDPNLVLANGTSNITRGSAASATAANNSFRTSGFKNDGISTDNQDYFQVTLSAKPGYTLSLSTIDANFNGTASFAASPGVSHQFAYSLDGTNFTLIASPTTTIGQPISLPTLDLTGVAAIQNVPEGTTITIRYYASGQTATGGWGLFSSVPGTNGLALNGTVMSQTLAVNLAMIKAKQQNDHVQVEWSNMTEQEVLQYHVERSNNGQTFGVIGTVNARSNNGGRVDYEFTDANPSPHVNYYRIRSLESTGNVNYSVIAKVDIGDNTTSLALYPNPVIDGQLMCKVNNLAKGRYFISIFNNLDQQVFQKSFDHQGGSLTELISVHRLKPGIYRMVWRGTKGTLTKTFVIK